MSGLPLPEPSEMEMPKTTSATTHYAEAYQAQYEAKDFETATTLYRALIDANPDAVEAGYSRSQLRRMVMSVISRDALVGADIALLCGHFDELATTAAARG